MSIVPLDIKPLSARELQCLSCLSEGNTCSKIAAHLSISVPTVAMHLKNARRKLHAVTSEHAIATAFRHGLLR
ncbi:MAG: response regulator transcription factor [Hyphomicrobium sp.]|uniref:response regulator transcription factor n=1 Tax=Hyphomicrobium sp. TaxID=82 RepID=UPI003D11E3FE